MSARFLNLPSLQVIKDPFFRKPPRKKNEAVITGKTRPTAPTVL